MGASHYPRLSPVSESPGQAGGVLLERVRESGPLAFDCEQRRGGVQAWAGQGTSIPSLAANRNPSRLLCAQFQLCVMLRGGGAGVAGMIATWDNGHFCRLAELPCHVNQGRQNSDIVAPLESPALGDCSFHKGQLGEDGTGSRGRMEVDGVPDLPLVSGVGPWPGPITAF